MTPEEIVAILQRDLKLLYDSQGPTPLRDRLADALRDEVAALREGAPAGRNPLTALDAQWLLDRGVTDVLDLREQWEWAPSRFGQEALDELEGRVVRRHIPVVDMGPPTPRSSMRPSPSWRRACGSPAVSCTCTAGPARSARRPSWWPSTAGGTAWATMRRCRSCAAAGLC